MPGRGRCTGSCAGSLHIGGMDVSGREDQVAGSQYPSVFTTTWAHHHGGIRQHHLADKGIRGHGDSRGQIIAVIIVLPGTVLQIGLTPAWILTLRAVDRPAGDVGSPLVFAAFADTEAGVCLFSRQGLVAVRPVPVVAPALGTGNRDLKRAVLVQVGTPAGTTAEAVTDEVPRPPGSRVKVDLVGHKKMLAHVKICFTHPSNFQFFANSDTRKGNLDSLSIVCTTRSDIFGNFRSYEVIFPFCSDTPRKVLESMESIIYLRCFNKLCIKHRRNVVSVISGYRRVRCCNVDTSGSYITE